MGKGEAELYALLDSLAGNTGRNILRGAAKAAATAALPIVQQAAGSLRTPEIKVGGQVKHASVRLADALKVVDSSRGDLIKSKLQLRKFPASVGIWAEHGTLGHWVTKKKGTKLNGLSVRTANRALRNGSLVIGKNFVGDAVYHPGAKWNPFMSTGADAAREVSAKAAADYVRLRLTKEGLAMPETFEPDEAGE
ncbi:hypothetical protein [uncultured Sphingomonas sp.]|uniref:hypothetical protein n=1 Tax=uncultured Sphingomonas sp. TaxID=158754 RepID=UPI0025EAFEB9|nr:hypothetical protein [uncultured Sphingomonas sp.]